VYLLVAWVFENEDHNFCVQLIEFTDDVTWDEDKLWSFYDDCNDRFHTSNTSSTVTWSMRGNVVMQTKLSVTYGLDYKLKLIQKG
jgi:hypothetical protein